MDITRYSTSDSTLDLELSSAPNLVSNVATNSGISDHERVTFNLNIHHNKPTVSRVL